MCAQPKEVKIVTLEGDTIEEIEAKATAVVNMGGTVIGGAGAVSICGDIVPALVIIRRTVDTILCFVPDKIDEDSLDEDI
jgi:hypothetical protein